MNKIQSQKSIVKEIISKVRILSFIFYLLPFALCLLFAPPLLSQEGDEIPTDAAPPPIKILSKEEKTSLDSLSDNIKRRTKVSLELMETRLLNAEKRQTASDFKQSLDELAGFHAILDNVLSHLIKTDIGKSDRSFITFEIYLRKQIPRLEAIRREMPFRYGYHVGNLMKAVRDARARAVEPIFDDTVVPTAGKKP